MLNQLCKAGIIRGMADDIEIRAPPINPVIILPNGNIMKPVMKARYLKTLADLSRNSWPPEQVGSLLIKVNRNYFTTRDLFSAYNQASLKIEAQQLTSFVIESK